MKVVAYRIWYLNAHRTEYVLRELLSAVPELVGGEGELPEEDLLAEELLAEAGQLVPRQPDLLQLTIPGYTQANVYSGSLL
jgi:hypothetical protein